MAPATAVAALGAKAAAAPGPAPAAGCSSVAQLAAQSGVLGALVSAAKVRKLLYSNENALNAHHTWQMAKGCAYNALFFHRVRVFSATPSFYTSASLLCCRLLASFRQIVPFHGISVVINYRIPWRASVC